MEEQKFSLVFGVDIDGYPFIISLHGEWDNILDGHNMEDNSFEFFGGIPPAGVYSARATPWSYYDSWSGEHDFGIELFDITPVWVPVSN